MFRRTGQETYVSLRAGFRWSVPERLNIAEVCADRHATRALAMVEVVGDDVREHTFGDVATRSRGEVVEAFVTLVDGVEPSSPTSDEIRDRVRTQLAAQEYPREVESVDELPMTTTGKIRRRDLRDRERARRTGEDLTR